jgi:uncharacterized glyoxalase superfamily protein PhnB
MVDEAPGLIAFLTEVFGATGLRRFEAPDGAVRHAELRIEDSVIMLSEGIPGWPAFPAWMHVYVPDVDATYQKALAAGGQSVQEPAVKPGDPDRRGGFKDPAGNTWWVSTQQGVGTAPA